MKKIISVSLIISLFMQISLYASCGPGSSRCVYIEELHKDNTSLVSVVGLFALIGIVFYATRDSGTNEDLSSDIDTSSKNSISYDKNDIKLSLAYRF